MERVRAWAQISCTIHAQPATLCHSDFNLSFNLVLAGLFTKLVEEANPQI